MKLAADAAAGPRFQPLAGETLQVRLTRPVPIPGETITVERVDLTEVPGARARRTTLGLESAEQPGRQLRGPPSGRREGSRASRSTASRSRFRRPAARCRCRSCRANKHVEIAWEAPIASVAVMIRTSAIELPGRAYNIALHLTLADRSLAAVRRRAAPRSGRLVLGRDAGGDRRCVAALAYTRHAALDARRRAARFRHESRAICRARCWSRAWLLVLLARLRYAERLQHATRDSFHLVQIVVAGVSIGRVDRAGGQRADGSARNARDAHRRQQLARRTTTTGSRIRRRTSLPTAYRPLAADVGLSRRDAGVVAVARVRRSCAG